MKLLQVAHFLILICTLSLAAYDWLPFFHPEGKFRQSKSRTEYLDDIYGYDVVHYDLNWDVTDTAGLIITGKVTISAKTTKPLKDFIFDLYDNMQLDSLVYSLPDNQTTPINPSEAMRTNHRVKLLLPQNLAADQNFSMQISYHGHPEAGSLMGLTFASHGNNKAVIASLSEPQDSRIWWPCKDIPSDKATADIYIVTHPHQLAASNGLLQCISTRPDGKLVHHWRTNYPTSTYLLSLAVSNYQKQIIYYKGINNDKNMPIEIYAYPEIADKTMEDCSFLPQMLKCFGNRFGEYPFLAEKYGIALFGWGGAMEHQTCTTYGSHLINGEHTYDLVMAHELAHQWLGNQVTCATWKDLWLQEGGASYLESIWQESRYGEAEYLQKMRIHKQYYFYEDAQARFPLYDPPLDYHFGRTTYNKGAWIYHTLRYLTGDTAFFNGMRNYLADPRWTYANATTEQFLTSMQNSSGVDLTAFKNEWIYSAGYPQYAWAYTAKGNELKLQLLQEQTTADNTPVFTTPIPLKITFSNGQDSVIQLQPAAAYQSFEFNFNRELSAVSPQFNWQEKTLCTVRTMPLDSASRQMEGRPVEIIQLYPNPCTNTFNLRYNIATFRMHDKLTCDIFNIRGQKVRTIPISSFQAGYNDQKIILKNLAKGMYMLKLRYQKARDYFDLARIVMVE